MTNENDPYPENDNFGLAKQNWERRNSARKLAQKFHEIYERLAPDFNYSTRKASAVPWADVPENNKNLMIAVAGELLASGAFPEVGEDSPIKAVRHTPLRPDEWTGLARTSDVGIGISQDEAAEQWEKIHPPKPTSDVAEILAEAEKKGSATAFNQWVNTEWLWKLAATLKAVSEERDKAEEFNSDARYWEELLVKCKRVLDGRDKLVVEWKERAEKAEADLQAVLETLDDNKNILEQYTSGEVGTATFEDAVKQIYKHL